MPRPIHFEILADEPEKAIEFYEKVFGWKFQKWEGPMEYWMVMTGEGPGIDGGLGRRDPDSSTMNTIDVPSVDDYLKMIEDSGGKIIAPKGPVPGIGWFAVIMDPQGNSWGLMEDDADAK